MEYKELSFEHETGEKDIELENRKGETVAIFVKESPEKKGAIVISPGWGGNKEQAQLQALSEIAFNSGYTSVIFDQTNNNGKSDGKYENGTVTGYIEDLEDIVNWAKTQSWYVEPFIVAGSSLGGMSSLVFAENNPSLIKGIVTIGAVKSGKDSEKRNPEKISDWKRTGFQTNKLRDGREVQVPWSHMEDRLKYDTLEGIDKIKDLPALILVGEKDDRTPPTNQAILSKALTKSTLVIIPGAEHVLRTETEIKILEQAFQEWLSKI